MEPTRLYLDTARMGRMSPHAQKAHLDFIRLAGDEGGSLFFERFLRFGTKAWSTVGKSRYPGLSCWLGVGALKESLRTLSGSEPDLPVLLANRSAQLMKLAARLLFHPCRNVLVADIGWLPYHEVVMAEAQRAGRVVTTAPIRQRLIEARTTEDEVVEVFRERFIQEGCDGLFLPGVSHLGLRLPVERIVRSLETSGQVRFVVIDGAQDFCHVSADLRNEYCDLYLAGSHKWLQAHHPMGLGFYGRRRSRGMIETVLTHLLSMGELDDPLLRFSAQLETGPLEGQIETVNLAPLFSCQGAVADAAEGVRSPVDHLSRRLENLATVSELATDCGWCPLQPSAAFRTGILLLQSPNAVSRNTPAEDLRAAFSDQGLAVTAYENGIVRLSMRDVPWRPDEIDLMRGALRSVA